MDQNGNMKIGMSKPCPVPNFEKPSPRRQDSDTTNENNGRNDDTTKGARDSSTVSSDPDTYRNGRMLLDMS